MRIIGLTGGIGAGKSTLATMLAERGAIVIDVDAIGRAVVGPGGVAEDAVGARFGPTIVADDGHIDRAALARIVFADGDALAGLEAIVHPAINAEIDRQLDIIEARGNDDALIVLDMAVLVGSRLGRDLPSGRGYDTVVVVRAPFEARVARLVHQRGMTEADARARIAAQPSDEAQRAAADHLIDNDGDRDTLRGAVDLLWDELCIAPTAHQHRGRP
jgi:dephospho-CoA kinase